MVANGDADAMLTGVTRVFSVAFNEISRVVDPKPNQRLMGVSLVAGRDHSFLISDTRIHEVPTPELADIAEESAQFARKFGHDPRVALLSFSNFGQPLRPHMERIRDAVAILEERKVDFEFDGDMQADVALDYDLMKEVFPFCRLTGPANVLVMPALHSASISSNLMAAVGGGTVIGPVLVGLSNRSNRTARVRQRSCRHRRFCRPRRIVAGLKRIYRPGGGQFRADRGGDLSAEAKDDLRNSVLVLDEMSDGLHCNRTCPRYGKPIDARRNRRERQAGNVVLQRDFKRTLVTACEPRIFVHVAALPYGSDGMDHMLRQQRISGGDLRISRRASAERAALGQ